MNATGPIPTGETIVVPFVDGPAGVQTTQSYSGPITLTVSGVGNLAGCAVSDAFYIYQECNGSPVTPPQHYTGRDNFGLQINLDQIDALVQPVPDYRPDHVYTVPLTAPGGPLTLGAGDDGTYDNAGQYAITITVPPAPSTPAPVVEGGAIPWRPHHAVRLATGLNANVDLADGHLDVSASDLSIPGRAFALSLGHTWDSLLAQQGVTSTAGQGWVSALTPQMGGSLTGTVVFTDSSGAVWPLVYSGDLTATSSYTAYNPPSALPWQLATSASITGVTTGYTLTDFLSGAAMTFNGQGRYTATRDSYGNINTLSYRGASGPSSMTNSGGHSLQFSYGSNGLLSEARSPLWQSGGKSNAASQHVTYGYSGSGQLAAITQGAGTNSPLTTTFGYSGTLLTSVTTPYTQSARTWTIGYDALGRVTDITSPVAAVMQPVVTHVIYNPGQTVVLDGYYTPGVLPTIYDLDAQGEPITVTDGLNDQIGYAYDQNHDITTVTDARGNVTTNYYAYVGVYGTTGLVTETDRPQISAYIPGNYPWQHNKSGHDNLPLRPEYVRPPGARHRRGRADCLRL